MDQNQLHTLDPKLREAYDRVMGTNAVPQQNPMQSPIAADQPMVSQAPIAPPLPVAPAMPAPSPVAPTAAAFAPLVSPMPITLPVSQQAPQEIHPAAAILGLTQPVEQVMPQAPIAPPQQPQSVPFMTAQAPAQPMAQYAPEPTPPPPPSPLEHPSQAPLSALDTTASTQMHAYVAEEVADVTKSIKLIQTMYIAGGIIFFAVYALFWVKFFNVALPF